MKKSKPRYGTADEMLKVGDAGLLNEEDEDEADELLDATKTKTKVKPKFDSKTPGKKGR